MQLDRAHRGFSFMLNGPLDMRMDTSAPLSAADIVNGWTEQALGKIIKEYGEDKKWRTIARRIVDARSELPTGLHGICFACTQAFIHFLAGFTLLIPTC